MKSESESRCRLYESEWDWVVLLLANSQLSFLGCVTSRNSTQRVCAHGAQVAGDIWRDGRGTFEWEIRRFDPPTGRCYDGVMARGRGSLEIASREMLTGLTTLHLRHVHKSMSS